MGRSISASAIRNRRIGQRRIRRRCTCGRIIGSNPGWWSHLKANDGAVDPATGKPSHRYDGRV